ncbi:uncharacterized protein LOC131014544 isoform X1 [Salvia miltiorrhiza]|uniref:uncharacterized protein LOC131014544 isoform X1 n=1 Tax=Salvia miltiorrhiza TaxID=226208 RepID=UPI0025AC85BD|nr:uncharacterized protein LOC131014544 isoform X1 [Salvia miltiorrhiza]
MVGLSLGEQTFIKGGIAQDLRTDGRKRLTYRPIFVETGIIPQASGSARVKLGATDVIASVKAELGKPNPSYPDKGKVSIYVDCSPTAEPSFEGRGGEELSTELSSALQRCLLGGKSGAGAGIDLSSLCIVRGKVCWDLYIDGLVVSSDGNVLDALGAAIKAALSDTAIPKVQVSANAPSDEQPEVDVSDEEFVQFDTSGVPVIVTLTKAKHSYFLHLRLSQCWGLYSETQRYMLTFAGRGALYCRCNYRRGVPDEFSCVCLDQQARPDMWADEERGRRPRSNRYTRHDIGG